MKRIALYSSVPFIVMVLIMLMAFRNPEKKNSNKSKNPVFTNYELPVFKVFADDLPKKANRGIGKYIIHVEFDNIADPVNSMNLLLNPVKNKRNYNTQPPIKAGKTALKEKLDFDKIIIGNSEIYERNLLKKKNYFFHYLLFTPKVFTDKSKNNILIFTITAYDVNGKPLNFPKTEDLSTLANQINSNPSPPYDPEK